MLLQCSLMLPIDVLYLSHIKYQLTCTSSMGDRWGALLEALTHYLYNIISSTNLMYYYAVFDTLF